MKTVFETKKSICIVTSNFSLFCFTENNFVLHSNLRLRPPPVGDHLGLTVWMVAYGRFECNKIHLVSLIIVSFLKNQTESDHIIFNMERNGYEAWQNFLLYVIARILALVFRKTQ